jgi:uncharacterized RDD family membrane protein YckC
MGRTLAAGTAVVFFVIALILVLVNVDRLAAGAALAGLVAMSVAVLLHVSDASHR